MKYVVDESHHYVDIANKCYDVGNFFVVTVSSHHDKKKTVDEFWDGECFRDDDIFDDEQEANKVALERTLAKLRHIIDTITGGSKK